MKPRFPQSRLASVLPWVAIVHLAATFVLSGDARAADSVTLSAELVAADPNQGPYPRLSWTGATAPYNVYASGDCSAVTAGYLASVSAQTYDAVDPDDPLVCYMVLSEAEVCGAPDEVEPNDTPGTETPLYAGPPIGTTLGAFSGDLQHGDDVDLYLFHVEEPGERLRLSVTGTGTPAEMDGRFMVLGPVGAPGLQRIGQNPEALSVTREMFFQEPGEYVLEVLDQRSFNGAAPLALPGKFCYTLDLTANPVTSPPALALPSAGSTTTTQHDVTPDGDVAVYMVTTPAGSYLAPFVFNLAATPATQGAGPSPTRQPDVDTIVTVWDPAAQRLVSQSDDMPTRSGGANTNSNTAAVLAGNLPGKEYWVVVDHYRLENEDAAEPGAAGGLQTTTTLTLREPIALSIPTGGSASDATRSLSASRPLQWYLATVPPGRVAGATAQASAPGSLTDIGAFVLDASGESLASSFAAAPTASASLSGVPSRSDRTLIAVAALDDLVKPVPGVTGAYSLTVSDNGGCPPVPGATVPAAGQLGVNEMLWDPPASGGDANGDGARQDQEDEFIELVNTSSGLMDLGGVSLSDASGPAAGLRFTFPCGTPLLPGQAAVVFGGGAPAGPFGFSPVFASNQTTACASGSPPRSLCLEDSTAESIVLRAASGATLATAPFAGLIANPDESYARCASPPGPSGGAAACDQGSSYFEHSSIAGVTTLFSPGAQVNGAAPATGEACQVAIPIVAGTIDDTLGGLDNYDGYGPTSGCFPYGIYGRDRAYRITVPVGMRLSGTVVPATSAFDPAVYLILPPAATCDLRPQACVAAEDSGLAGDPETFGHTNASGSSEDVFIVVDSYTDATSDPPHAFSMTTTVEPLVEGETCQQAVVISPGTRDDDLFSHADDYDGFGPSTGCLDYAVDGPDRVYSITVPAGMRLTVAVSDVPPGQDFDPVLTMVQAPASTCDAQPQVCLAAEDSGLAGAPETASYTNATGAARVIFVIVDSLLSGGSGGPGDFRLTTTLDLPGTGGETCQAATPITTGMRGETMAGFVNDYSGLGISTGCFAYPIPGPDRVYAIDVPSMQKLTVMVSNLPEGSTFDPAIYLIGAPASSCDAQPPACLASEDSGFSGEPETMAYNNYGAGRTVFIIVDTYLGLPDTFTLTATLGPADPPPAPLGALPNIRSGRVASAIQTRRSCRPQS